MCGPLANGALRFSDYAAQLGEVATDAKHRSADEREAGRRAGLIHQERVNQKCEIILTKRIKGYVAQLVRAQHS